LGVHYTGGTSRRFDEGDLKEQGRTCGTLEGDDVAQNLDVSLRLEESPLALLGKGGDLQDGQGRPSAGITMGRLAYG
jgi:hypothetical protein